MVGCCSGGSTRPGAKIGLNGGCSVGAQDYSSKPIQIMAKKTLDPACETLKCICVPNQGLSKGVPRQGPPIGSPGSCSFGDQAFPPKQVIYKNKPPIPQSNRCVSDNHDEEVCHGTNERRRDLINQVKIFLEDFDDRPCKDSPSQTGRNELKKLGEYDQYLKKHCQSWTPPNPCPPIITSIATHEVRITEDYERMKENNNEYVTYVDARFKPPPMTCDCVKRNGMQDKCSHLDCKPPTAECLATNPGPCCPPSLGLTKTEMTAGKEFQQGKPFSSAINKQVNGKRGGVINQEWGFSPNITPQYRPMISTMHTAPNGQQIMCFCEVERPEMPSGKKYLCCPANINPVC